MSLGSRTASDGRDSLSLAVNAAADAGIVVVVAAGNNGPEEYTVGSPAAAEKAITIAASQARTMAAASTSYVTRLSAGIP